MSEELKVSITHNLRVFLSRPDKESRLFFSCKVNFSTNVSRRISQVITNNRYLIARWQPVKEFKCVFVCVARVAEVSAECNAAVRRVITHSSVRRSLVRSHPPINRDGLKIKKDKQRGVIKSSVETRGYDPIT